MRCKFYNPTFLALPVRLHVDLSSYLWYYGYWSVRTQ